MAWFGVRCIVNAASGLYEERITLWESQTEDVAIASAEHEAADYASAIDGQYIGFCQAYAQTEIPQNGAEVFSLLRDSDLAADEYVTRFFATGAEHERNRNDNH